MAAKESNSAAHADHAARPWKHEPVERARHVNRPDANDQKAN